MAWGSVLATSLHRLETLTSAGLSFPICNQRVLPILVFSVARLQSLPLIFFLGKLGHTGASETWVCFLVVVGFPERSLPLLCSNFSICKMGVTMTTPSRMLSE